MGGGGCIIIIHALVRYRFVPSRKSERRELEAQLRECYANPLIAEELEKNEANAERLWTILQKPELEPQDLQALLDGLPQYTE